MSPHRLSRKSSSATVNPVFCFAFLNTKNQAVSQAARAIKKNHLLAGKIKKNNAPRASQNSRVRAIHFNMLKLLLRVLYYCCKINVSPAKGKFNTKLYHIIKLQVLPLMKKG